MIVIITIIEEILIAAPVEVCFDASRDIQLHTKTVWPLTREIIVSDRKTGLLEHNELITFEARHLGIRQQLTSKVAEYMYPNYFVDVMQKGAFKQLSHQHEFEQHSNGTLVRDILQFQSPYGWIGSFIDAIVLKHYMRSFLRYRQRSLKEYIENSM
ncbi:SRPBCC family protein [Paenibacillus endoradicis]|uniref:SRPBCC family protein n=1 Tax=Paenibacillus endoradicis TaxID=2972487 RepID=UPI0021591CCF|nr:SRPBCC family protein [Paenibacillus endoradicis]MCR8656432.1 SRPBCC family protein [Paenibacillus endoradicis]